MSARSGVILPACGVAMIAAIAAAGPVAADAGGDRALAEDALLRVSDLPDGWADTGSAGEAAALPDVRKCDDLRRVDRAARGREAIGPSFTLVENATDGETATTVETERSVAQSVAVFASVRAARRYFDAYAVPDALACFEASIEESPPADGLGLDAQRLDEIGDRGLGDEGVGYELDAALVFDGEVVGPISFSAEIYRVGRAVTRLSYASIDVLETVPDAPTISTAAVERLRTVDD